MLYRRYPVEKAGSVTITETNIPVATTEKANKLKHILQSKAK